MRNTQILIAGGGAAGMMASLAAARNCKDIIIIEKMPQPGKKILATGNGRCNYTNYYQSEECYRGTDSRFAWNLLQKFGCMETVELFKTYGIMPYEKNGYIYPLSEQAADVRNVLKRQIENANVDICTNEKVVNINVHLNKKTRKKDGFIVETDKNNYYTRKLIISTGGKAGAVHGSDGYGYKLAKSLGHSLIPPVTALTSCILDENFLKEWAGTRTKGTVTAYSETGHLLSKDSGELQFVAQGISGIPVFQVSRYISAELYHKKKPYLVIDIMPLYCIEEITNELKRRIKNPANLTVCDIFEGIINKRLAQALLKKCSIPVKREAAGITHQEITKIAKTIKEWHLTPKATGSFEKAQVTCGGVKTSEINNNTLESKICNGLYFAGEIIDIDGICGGYNLQWAWTSGYIAGTSAAESFNYN